VRLDKPRRWIFKRELVWVNNETCWKI